MAASTIDHSNSGDQLQKTEGINLVLGQHSVMYLPESRATQGCHHESLRPHSAGPRLSRIKHTACYDTRDVIIFEMPLFASPDIVFRKALIQNLILLTQFARQLGTHIPFEVIDYVEKSRNPDIYTREYVEVVMKNNQEQKGRSEALATFQEILGRDVAAGIPDMREDVSKIVEASGGRLER